MKINKTWIGIGIILIIFMGSLIIKHNLKKYVVIESNDNRFIPIYQNQDQTYYYADLKEIKYRKNGKEWSLKKTLEQEKITIEEVLEEAIQKVNDVNGTVYMYKDFKIYYCQRIYEDHVKPNQDIIISSKNFQLDFTKHCLFKK